MKLFLDLEIRKLFYKLHICSPGNNPSDGFIICVYFWIKCLTWPQLNNSSLFPIHYLPAVQTKVPLRSAGPKSQMTPYEILCPIVTTFALFKIWRLPSLWRVGRIPRGAKEPWVSMGLSPIPHMTCPANMTCFVRLTPAPLGCPSLQEHEKSAHSTLQYINLQWQLSRLLSHSRWKTSDSEALNRTITEADRVV